MGEIQPLERTPGTFDFLWVDLMSDPDASMSNVLHETYDMCRVRELHQVSSAIRLHAPPFVCFEVDDPDTGVFESLMRVRHDHPQLPVLVITSESGMVAAKWAVRLKVWDLLVKPVADDELKDTLCSIASMCDGAEGSARQGAPQAGGRSRAPCRTSAALAYVEAHFAHRISLERVASVCQLSPSQFCRVFRKEHEMSFVQYLLCFRMERAREFLAREGTLIKEIAYAVGFTDMSYFTRSFKQHFGVCPGAFRAGAHHAASASERG